jgi:Flp pilus assembly protein TadD
MRPATTFWPRWYRATEAKHGLARAEMALRAWTYLNPGDAKAHHSLGHAFESQGKLEEAVDEYRAIIRLWPGHACAYNNLGQAPGSPGSVTP